jgi:transcriptional regulator with XRE-family HTH domain
MEMSEVKIAEHMATEEKPFHFVDSGLDNVFLVGIKYFVHSDGRVVAEIPALKQLMQLIAKDLVFCPTVLSGSEVRFLRKRLGAKSSVMADHLRVEAETYSRIENAKQSVSPQMDLIVRMVYCILSGDDELMDHCKAVLKIITDEMKKRSQAKILTLKISIDNTWSDLQEAA